MVVIFTGVRLTSDFSRVDLDKVETSRMDVGCPQAISEIVVSSGNQIVAVGN
jgi:hypothetical protein